MSKLQRFARVITAVLDIIAVPFIVAFLILLFPFLLWDALVRYAETGVWEWL